MSIRAAIKTYREKANPTAVDWREFALAVAQEIAEEKLASLEDDVRRTLDLIAREMARTSFKGEKGHTGPRGYIGPQGEPGQKGDPGREGKAGRDGEDGKDGKDGSPDTPDQVVDKVIASKRTLPQSKIEGLDQDLNALRRAIRERRGTVKLGGGGGNGNGNGSGVTVETPAGTVNGVTTVFTVTAEPKWIIADGAIYFAGAGYSYATLQVTMDLAPSMFIRAII